MHVTLALVEMARGSDGAPLRQHELQHPLLARSIQRQLLGHALKVGDRRAATVLGRRREFEVVEVSAKAERGHITVEEGIAVHLRADSSAAQPSPDVALPRSSWHSEANTAMAMNTALAGACAAAWSKEISDLNEVLHMVMAVRGAAQLPLGISRGVLLQAASGGGKTMLLRYFMQAARARNTSPVPATAMDIAQGLQADRLSRLSQQRRSDLCDTMPPFSVLAFSGVDVRTGRAPASAQGDSLVSFLAHANASSRQDLSHEEGGQLAGHEPAALLVWFDDLDVLLATEPGGDDDDESVSVDASTARRQLLAWLSQLPHSSNIVVVGSVSDAAITAKAVPGLVSAGRLSRSLVLPPPSRMARQRIISVTLRGLLATQPRVISRDSASTADHSDPSSMHRMLDAVDELAIWGAGRTGGYLPGDLVRWCRRAHLRASVSASRARSLGLVTDATRAKASTSGGDGGLGAPEIEGALDFDAVELQRALSTALVEVVPASLGHPWEVTPSTRSSASGSGGVWSALAGYENVKTELRRMLAWPEQHSDAWTALALPRPKGVLLHGPSGCGKTVLARGLATAFPALNVLEVRGTALFSPLVGEAEAALRDVVKRARAAAPCLLILDELDSIAPARSGSDDNGDEVGRRLLGTLLNEMDGIGHVNAGSSSSSSAQSDMKQLRSQDGVIFVGCSNRRDAIDPAVLRPGRIDKHIEVPLPDLKNKLEILLFATDAMPLATDVDLSSLAAHPRLLAASGAELIGVCRDAAFAALREASTGNTMDQATSRQGTAISVAARHFATALAKCPVGPNC